ncbi:MAG: type II toxin-antitoxin system prevent-host-death family antitoxin [Acidobacteriia bacterium]|nr:type II toxin-antitoxin system prevent-host-death family antitoxin [Terriglobia bacterium]
MVRSLRESKAKLSELVEAASRGEDVLITVRGKIKARLTRAEASHEQLRGADWARQLRTFQRGIAARGTPRLSTGRILAEDREER